MTGTNIQTVERLHKMILHLGESCQLRALADKGWKAKAGGPSPPSAQYSWPSLWAPIHPNLT